MKEPVTFFVGGVRYRIATASKLKPYISGGVGLATVKKDVKFLIGGADASSTLSQFVTLGTDIAGDESKMMFTVGAGVGLPGVAPGDRRPALPVRPHLDRHRDHGQPRRHRRRPQVLVART